MARPAWRPLIVATLGVTALGSLLSPASAEDDITLEPNQVLIAEPGTLQPVASEGVAAELQGQTCDLRIVAENGHSVHPGNTVIVTTGESRVETPGVEDVADGRVLAVHQIVLGETVEVGLLMGPEGLSSLGFTIGIDCAEPPVQAPVIEGGEQEQVTPSTEAPSPTVLPNQQEAPPVKPATPAQAHTGEPHYTG